MTTPRHQSHTRGLLATVAVAIPAMLIGSGLSAPAQAGYMVTLDEVGSNVVATGSGTIDLAGLSFVSSFLQGDGIHPSRGYIFTGPTSASVDSYTGFTGPTSFGSGDFTSFPSSGSGQLIGINGAGHFLGVPAGYVSGSALSDTATWDSQTFSSLGVTPGTYTWTWGAAADDSFMLQIGPTAVPAPLIDRGLPVLLAVGGLLFGAKLLERDKRRGLQFG